MEDDKIKLWLEALNLSRKLVTELLDITNDIDKYISLAEFWKHMGVHLIPVCINCNKLHYTITNKNRFIRSQIRLRLEGNQNEGNKKTWFQELEFQICSCPIPKITWKTPSDTYYRGLILDYDKKKQDLCRNISRRLITYSPFYREIYQKHIKEFMCKKDIQYTAASSKALKVIGKLFIAHLYEVARTVKGLPVEPFYLKKKLGEDFRIKHTEIRPPFMELIKEETK